MKANSLLKIATIAAILVGSIGSGYIADYDVSASLGLCCILFFSTVANFFIPPLKPTRPNAHWGLGYVLDKFKLACLTIWHNRQARFSLLGTSLFWARGFFYVLY